MGAIIDSLAESLGYVSVSEAQESTKSAVESAVEDVVNAESLRSWNRLAEFLGIDSGKRECMSEATYYACMKILRETLGKLPLKLMQRMPDGGIRVADDDPLGYTLGVRPNPYMTATSFWSCVEQHRNHHGNAFVLMTGSDTKSDPTKLWIMPPDEVEVWYDDLMVISDVPDVYYRWSHGGDMRVLKSCEVMHFRSSDTYDGIVGIPLIDRLKSEIDGALVAQEFQNGLISSGMTAKAVLQYTSDLDKDAAKNFAKNIEMYAKGDFTKDGVKSIIPLPVGASLQPLNIKLTDAQFMELKKYSAVQIASAIGIKPQQIGDMTKQSYASSQAQQEAFYTDTMLYILRDYENEIMFKAAGKRRADSGYFVEFDTSVMLRSDYKTQIEANKMGIESGQLKPNEARAKLNLPNDPDGDKLLGNGNLIPIGMVGMQYRKNDGLEGGE